MNILAIDPGTKCGYCVMQGKRIIASGTWDLSVKRGEGGGMRFIRLRKYLDEVCKQYPPDFVLYEASGHFRSIAASAVYHGIVGKIMEHCEDGKLAYEGVPLATLKVYATGKGNANKEAMRAAAERRLSGVFHGLSEADDNEIDAVWLGLWGLENRAA